MDFAIYSVVKCCGMC